MSPDAVSAMTLRVLVQWSVWKGIWSVIKAPEFQWRPLLDPQLTQDHLEPAVVCVSMSGESAVRAVVPGGGHAAVDDAVYTRASPQLALLRRYPVLLHLADTALGTTSRQLVLNPDVLTPGRKYFAKVTAFHKRTT